MCAMTNLLKHFMMIRVSATGYVFSTSMMVVDLKHVGTDNCLRDVLKMSVMTPPNWSAFFDHPARYVVGSSSLMWIDSE